MKHSFSNLIAICFFLFLFAGTLNFVALGQPGGEPLKKILAKTDDDEELLTAASDDQWQKVKRLLLRGANSNAVRDDNGYAALHYAAPGLQLEIVNLLLQKGAKVDAVTKYGATALQLSITAGEAKDQARLDSIVKALLKAGANPNAMSADGETILTEAVADTDTNVALVKILLAGGANPNLPNRFGETAVQVMLDRNRKDAVFQLLSPLTKEPFVKPKQQSDQDLYNSAVNDNLPRFKRLLEAGANPNAVDATGSGSNETPLHRAAWQCNLGMIRLLLERGAKVNVTDEYNFTPLFRAVAGCADKPEQRKVVKVLLAAKADVNVQNKDGETALLAEAEKSVGDSDVEIIKMLLAAGADPSVADNEDQNALDAAIVNENKEALAILTPVMKPFLEKQAKALAEMRAKLPGRFYTADDGAEIYYEVRGAKTGTPLFVLHGGPGFDSKYFSASNAFDEIGKNRPVVFYDQRGGGYSSSKLKAGQTPDVKRLVADLNGLMRHLGYQKIALAGHSWGGYLAMAFAAAHPEKVSRLILIDSVTPNYDQLDNYIDFEAKFPDDYGLYRRKRTEAAFNRDRKSRREFALAYMKMLFFSPEKRDKFIAGADAYTINLEINSVIGGSASEYELEPSLRKLNVPTLIVHGEHDANIKLEVATDVLNNLIPKSQVIIFNESGHLPFYEEPEKFARVVENFLSERGANQTKKLKNKNFITASLI